VAQLIEKPARDIITAGTSTQTMPAHSPIPDLFLAAVSGGADPYKWGVASTAQIHDYLLDQIRNPGLTPQGGRLDDPNFAEGRFLFRVLNLPQPQEANTIEVYRERAASGDAIAQVQLGYLYDHGKSGLAKDQREAARLYTLSANQGNAQAEANLGVFYGDGLGGLAKDEREAARLFKLSADQGDERARNRLLDLTR
jgi:hypothetical protein